METQRALKLEEEPLLITYETGGGRCPSNETRHHLRHTVDMILIGHVPSNDPPTLNTKITMDDVYGIKRRPGPLKQLMCGVTYPGAAVDIPTRAAQFLINR